MEMPGLIVAPLTPFTASLDVDEPALRRQIDYVVQDCRATMVVAAGVLGACLRTTALAHRFSGAEAVGGTTRRRLGIA
jgi:dihydrodipicolinate synthase/N-acetylneuraminate lyase